MPRLRPLSLDEAPQAARPLMAAASRASGKISVGVGIQARCPEILEAGRQLSAAPGRSNTLSAELRSLICLRAAQIITCPF
jgi:alkylhydroperoxidase family enzyme